MAQWGKRRAAGVARGIMISVMVGIMILVLFVTGILQAWLEDIDWGVGMFVQESFYMYLFIMVILVGLLMFCIRNAINWGGA